MPEPLSGPNDGTWLMWYDEAGNAVDAVEWREARDRLAAFLMGDTGNPGWAVTRSEDLLAAMFTIEPERYQA